MPIGAGKYDEFCTYIREKTGSRAVAVIVLDGSEGAGFAIQAESKWQKDLPDILEYMAKEMRNGGV
jgi:hypothetical protein